MGKTLKEEKKIVAESETPEETVVEVARAPRRDKEFYKRHPGALDGVIYE
jgi:hypothetical protein